MAPAGKVWCLLVSHREKVEALAQAFAVEFPSNTNVDNLRKIIKKEAPVPLECHAEMLTVWKCVDPKVGLDNMDIEKFNAWLNVSFSFATGQRKVERLMPWMDVGDPGGPLLIEVPASQGGGFGVPLLHSAKKRKLGDDTKQGAVDDGHVFKRVRARAVESVSDDWTSASKAAGDLLAHVQQVAPVYNGIPARNTDPPIELFHPIFDTFKRFLTETVDIPADIRKLAWEYSEACVAIYESERDRETAMHGILRKVLYMQPLRLITQLVNSGNVGIQSIGHSHESQHQAIIFLEFKNQFGKGGSDPYDQACFAYQRHWGDPGMEALMNICYCPTFLIASAGPWMCVAGAIYHTDAIIQPLTNGYEWIGPLTNRDVRRHRVERLFFALRYAICSLREYYTSLSDVLRDPDHQQDVKGYPYITSCDEFTFSYVARLVPHNSQQLVYKARREDNGDLLVVKFTGAYNEEAHRLLHANGYAPALYYIGRTVHDLYMVVMQYVEGTQPSQGGLTEAQYEDVKKAVELLHAKDIVFGDLRTPNVLVKDEDGHALLLDFDDCGRDEKDQYPFDINMSLSWAAGVGPGTIMKKKHDIDMLGKL